TRGSGGSKLRFQMKMFEGVDCTSTRSSRDLWAEICSCLPNPDQEDGASNAFSDSFVDSYPESEGQRGAAAFAVELPIKPWAPLQDSEMYLASLGKLNDRGLTILLRLVSNSWSQAILPKCWDYRLPHLAAIFFYYFLNTFSGPVLTLEHFKRWLQPDKVAISTEEVQYLIPPESQVEKPAAGEEPAAREEPPAAEQ
uniref:Coiled-coil domain containing 32 n=1 Tax=Microcebus murinus TaxID=30608 RepID=A0A8C5UV85_MICMU